MKILFLTVLKINAITDRGIYPDLLRKFYMEGLKVYIVTPLDRSYRQKTVLEEDNNIAILKIKTFNIQKTHYVGKWLASLSINRQFFKGIMHYFPFIKFDVIIYPTPPITIYSLIIKIKKITGAMSYLLLKDIFPQNAVDLGLIRRGSIFHRYYLRMESKLYTTSDYIGCMSQANVDYLIHNFPEIDRDKLEINPNSHELFKEEMLLIDKDSIRKNYKIPLNKTLFIYGGNLGKPQGVDFILDFLGSQSNNKDAFFLIVGSGTEYKKIESWFKQNLPTNAMLMSEISKHDYNMILRSSDVGMIFLDRRFTVPNFPSRILSYLEYRLPVLAATDKSTDLGEIIVENMIGLWSESGDLEAINQNVSKLVNDSTLRSDLGHNGFRFFVENYTVERSYETIMNHIKEKSLT